MSNLYGSGPDGFCGDEDTGQMAAWYVFSALGFYPVCPGTPDYILGSPLFDRATLKLGAKTFTINAQSNGQQRPYIQAATLESQPFNRTTLRHEELLRGGTLMLRMDSAPNKGWPEP
jgi:putative alpha-1,2-mannosidase